MCGIWRKHICWPWSCWGRDARPRAHHFNLGTGRGHSVLEMVRAAEQVLGRLIPVDPRPRRPGDPAILFADPGLALRVMGWRAVHSSAGEIIRSAWQHHRRESS